MKKGTNKIKWPEDWPPTTASELCKSGSVTYVQVYENGYYKDFAPGSADIEIAPGVEASIEVAEDDYELKRPEKESPTVPTVKEHLAPTVKREEPPTVTPKPVSQKRKTVKYK